MTSLPLVDPELQDLLSLIPYSELNDSVLAQARAAQSPPFPARPDVPGVHFEERSVPGENGQPDVRVLVYRPEAASTPLPSILHVHGGGMVSGTPEMNDFDNRTRAKELNVVIVSVDYRLAPEYPFPAAVEDCYTALRWLYREASSLGADPARIALKGESAGGGIAAGLALLARDRGEIPIAYQCLLYPMIEDRPSADPHPYTGEFMWTAASNRYGWRSYLGQEPGGSEVPIYAAPARARDLGGLPPAIIVTSTLDLFLEENIEYARRLTRAGVPVELVVYPGAYHGFEMAGDSRLNRRIKRDVNEALTLALAVGRF